MPFSPTRNADQFRTGFEEEIANTRIDGLFDGDFIACADQGPAEQIERLLAAVGDQDVICVARRVARGTAAADQMYGAKARSRAANQAA